MKKVKVVSISSNELTFSDGTILTHEHEQDCCECHYLSFSDLSMLDFEGLQFDLSTDSFFKRIKDYGIELIPLNGDSVKVPGYGSNNGYYSENLSLTLSDGRTFNITECQTIEEN